MEGEIDGQFVKVENPVADVRDGHETSCWGCGLRLLLSYNTPVYKCGWCGAITDHNQRSRKADSACFSCWRRVRDRFFVIVLFIFMIFIICGGVWAVFPVIFSISYSCGIFHCTITAIFTIWTVSSFLCASYQSAGEPPNIQWGSYPVVVKHGLENYTFCSYCAKPKCPRTHHCRSCRMCVLDMDHHCPFIGNCVGAANHRYFVFFLISVIVSCTYVVIMAMFAISRIWPPLEYGPPGSLIRLRAPGTIVKQVLTAMVESAMFLSVRGFVLIYLAMACFSVEIGISVLLWQQLQFIYEGKTYIDHITSNGGAFGERGCQNILRFFNCPHWAFRLLNSSNAGKQEASYSKIL